jgi:hypothetical protein
MNYMPRVLGVSAQDGKTALFVEELYGNLFNDLYTAENYRCKTNISKIR